MNLKEQKEAEINEKLGKQMDEFLNSKWSELVYQDQPVITLSDWFKDAFKKVIINTTPGSNEILSHQLHAIGITPLGELAVGQVGLMFSVFNFALPSCFETDYDAYVEKRKEIDQIMFTFNFLHKSKEIELANSKKFAMSMYDSNGLKRNTSKFIN